jgi:hypothetical protein
MHEIKETTYDGVLLAQDFLPSMALQAFGPWSVFQFLNPIHSR